MWALCYRPDSSSSWNIVSQSSNQPDLPSDPGDYIMVDIDGGVVGPIQTVSVLTQALNNVTEMTTNLRIDQNKDPFSSVQEKQLQTLYQALVTGDTADFTPVLQAAGIPDSQIPTS